MDFKRHMTAKRARGIALACAAGALIATASGCGVRCNQMLVDEPLPIAGDNQPPVCQTIESKKAFTAPQWLVRHRHGWHRWRHGEEVRAPQEEFVIPPSPRFHPVPTRPVFAPLEFEAPPGATMKPMPEAAKTEAPKPPTEDVPAPVPQTPPAAAPAPEPAKEPAKEPDAVSRANPPIAPPRLTPRALAPKATTAARPAAIPTQPKSSSVTKVPDSPQATAPLPEAASRPEWRTRR